MAKRLRVKNKKFRRDKLSLIKETPFPKRHKVAEERSKVAKKRLINRW